MKASVTKPVFFEKTGFSTLITLLFCSHALFYYFALGTDAVDDAYISFRYAQNAIRGHGLVFNPNERVEGYTNFLWTAAMVPLEGARADVGRAAMLAGALLGLGTIFFALSFTRTIGAPRAVGWIAALLLAADGSFALWSVGGMETPLFAFLIFAGGVFYVKENVDARKATRATIPFSGIFFALAAMTRPEGVLVFAVTIAHQAAWRLLTERRLFSPRDLARVALFAALFAPYWAGRWAYYRSFLPNTFHAKVSAVGPAAQIERGWTHLWQFVNVHLGWLIALPPLGTLVGTLWRVARSTKSSNPPQPKSFRKLLWISYFTALIVLYIAYIIYVGGDWSVGRFFAPLLPPFYLLLSTGLVDLWNWIVEKSSAASLSLARTAAVSASTALVLAIFLTSSWNGEHGTYIKGFDAGRATLARVTMGKWLRMNVPRDTLIAVDAAGQMPYFAELAAIDLFGINDLHIGRLQVETLGRGTPGHEKMDLVYVILRQPEYVIIFGDLFDSIKEYERAPETWTTDESLKKFLMLYRRRAH